MLAENLLIQIASQGFGGLLANLMTKYSSTVGRKIKQNSSEIKTDFKEHLEVSFQKCTKVKTILNSDEPADTLAIYVDQIFKVKDKEIDQYSMVEKIRAGSSVVVTGEGGGGKSMFMRYLWLSFFERSDGKIPFFLELRSLNSLSHNNFSDFVYHSIIKSGSSIRQADFLNALKAGEFILFLDGFDEINFSQRDAIQEMILNLKENNPKVTIVVTSRDDERFMGWASFAKASVSELPKEKSKELIQKAKCDDDLRAKFLKRFDVLWGRHSDFMSNPLLAYMMLVTFSFNPDIPRKMFQFYEQAFEALYHRHDLTKGYKRKFHTDLDKFSFIRLISYLCLKTYYDERLEFTRMDLAEQIESVKKIDGVNVEVEAFIDDLVQSVCIIKPEGLTYTFTHRSFQEYFAAYCISRVAARSIDKFFINFAKRYSDKVLPMVYDINPDLFRSNYIIPNYKRFSSFFDRKTDRGLYYGFGKRVGAVFTIRELGRHPDSKRQTMISSRDFSITLKYTGEMSDFYHVIKSISWQYGDELKRTFKCDEDFMKLARELYDASGQVYLQIEFSASGPEFAFIDKRGSQVFKFSGDDLKALRKAFLTTRMQEFMTNEASLFLTFVKDEVQKNNIVAEAFSDFF